MTDVRIILNKIKWTGDLHKVTVWYRHWGAPQNIRSLHGKDISTIGRSFLETKSAMIPYHRVLKIEYTTHVLFERPAKKR